MIEYFVFWLILGGLAILKRIEVLKLVIDLWLLGSIVVAIISFEILKREKN